MSEIQITIPLTQYMMEGDARNYIAPHLRTKAVRDWIEDAPFSEVEDEYLFETTYYFCERGDPSDLPPLEIHLTIDGNSLLSFEIYIQHKSMWDTSRFATYVVLEFGINSTIFHPKERTWNDGVIAMESTLNENGDYTDMPPAALIDTILFLANTFVDEFLSQQE